MNKLFLTAILLVVCRFSNAVSPVNIYGASDNFVGGGAVFNGGGRCVLLTAEHVVENMLTLAFGKANNERYTANNKWNGSGLSEKLDLSFYVSNDGCGDNEFPEIVNIDRVLNHTIGHISYIGLNGSGIKNIPFFIHQSTDKILYVRPFDGSHARDGLSGSPVFVSGIFVGVLLGEDSELGWMVLKISPVIKSNKILLDIVKKKEAGDVIKLWGINEIWSKIGNENSSINKIKKKLVLSDSEVAFFLSRITKKEQYLHISNIKDKFEKFYGLENSISVEFDEDDFLKSIEKLELNGFLVKIIEKGNIYYTTSNKGMLVIDKLNKELVVDGKFHINEFYAYKSIVDKYELNKNKSSARKTIEISVSRNQAKDVGLVAGLISANKFYSDSVEGVFLDKNYDLTAGKSFVHGQCKLTLLMINGLIGRADFRIECDVK